MNAVDTDMTIDSNSSASSGSPRRSRRYWLGVGAAVAGIAVATAGLALVRPGDEASRVIVEPFTPAPTTVVSHDTVTPPLTESPPPPAPLPRELTEASRLQLDRIGGVQVGMTLEEASAAAGKPITIVPGSNLPGTGRCAHAVPENGPEGLRFMVLDGRIVRIEVGRGPVATLEGVTTHTPVQDVLATYAGRIRVEPHTYAARTGGQYLIYEPDGANGMSMLFETDGSRVTQFRSGVTGAVMAPEGCA